MSKQQENTPAPKRKIFTRRNFLLGSTAGVGIVIGAGYLSRNVLRRYLYELADDPANYFGDTSTPSLWFEVLKDNSIIIHSPKVEMGQGSFTAFAQIAADELDVDIKQIQVVHAETQTGNIDGVSTGGSTSVAGLWMPLRQLAATLRQMLINEAATLLNVEASQLKTSQGSITSGEKSVTYGEVASQVTEWSIPDTPPLKDVKDYKYVGKPVARVDLKAKVIGEPIFGIDASAPNMLYGSVARSSLIGAKLVSADTSKAEKMPGVIKVIVEEDFVGVVAKSMTEAENAKDAVETKWSTEKVWQSEDIKNMIKVGQGESMLIQTHGNADSLLQSNDVITSEYHSPIGAHAQLEPNGALADVKEDKATITMSTQVVSITRNEVANRLGLKLKM